MSPEDLPSERRVPSAASPDHVTLSHTQAGRAVKDDSPSIQPPRAAGAVRTLNLDEAAEFLHMHAEEVRARAKRGLIPGAKAGRRWVFLEPDLAQFVRSL